MNINDTMTINGAAPSAQKSHAEIIAECYHNSAATRYVRKLLDRLDAAHKREFAKLREVMNRVHDYLGELIRDNLVEDTPRASDLADDVYDAIHGSHPTAEKSSHGMCDYKCPCIDSGDKCHCLCKWLHCHYQEGVAK